MLTGKKRKGKEVRMIKKLDQAVKKKKKNNLERDTDIIIEVVERRAKKKMKP